MALRLQLAKRLLSDSNLIKSQSQFSTTTSFRSRIDDTIKKHNASLIDKIPGSSDIQERQVEEDFSTPNQHNLSELGGVPKEHVVERMARITKVTKSSMQSGTNNTQTWIIQFDNRQRWENDLMGWVSSGDPLSNLELRFPSVESAVSYCDRQGYPYYIEKEKTIAPRKKSYAAIFSWNKRTRSSTK